MVDLFYLPAVEVLRLFRTQELSPVSYLEALIARLAETEPLVNAVSEQLYDNALKAAAAAEKRYRDDPAGVRPLEGLPVAIKDFHPMAGFSNSQGSLALVNEIASTTHPVVERLIDAGAIPHIRTTNPELSCAGFTHSKLWGVTRNPWNTHYSPGGSSGGSAAVLAAGGAPLATGSDIGGSIRTPASFTGTVAFKSPYGRVPALPPGNLDHYASDGSMARTVADCALMQNVISGPHRRDIASLRPKLTIPTELEGIAGLRVAYVLTLGDWPMEAEIANNTRKAAVALASRGAHVEEVSLDWPMATVQQTAYIHYGHMFARGIQDIVDQYGDLTNDYTRAFADVAIEALESSSYIAGLEAEADLYMGLSEIFEHFDALLCPTVATTGIVAGESYVDTPLIVAGVELERYNDAWLTFAFSILNRCPVLNIPTGFARNGVPTGVQVVGRTYDDVTTFRIGAALESELEGRFANGRVPQFVSAPV